MKLYATMQSERGKDLQKGANDYLAILINNENRENQYHIIVSIDEDGSTQLEVLEYSKGKITTFPTEAK